MIFHIHKWSDIGRTYYWEYPEDSCVINFDRRMVEGYRIATKDNPGEASWNCRYTDHPPHLWIPYPYTTLQQRCSCGKYRTQNIEGILDEQK